MTARRQARAGLDQTSPHGIPGALLSRFHPDWSDPRALGQMVALGYMTAGDLSWLKRGLSVELIRHRCLAIDPQRLGIADPKNPEHIDYHALGRITTQSSALPKEAVSGGA